MEHQGPRRNAYVKISVAGQDVTSRFAPYLISVQVITVEGGQDKCNIELDDRNAELIIPGDSAAIQVVMGWHHEGPRIINVGASMAALQPSRFELEQEAAFGGPGAEVVFEGHLANCESGFGRKGGGRRLWLECEAGMPKGKAKENQNDSIGEGKKRGGEEGAAGAQGMLGAISGMISGMTLPTPSSVITGMLNGPFGPTVAAGSSATSVVSTLTPEGFLTDSIGDKNAPKDAPGTFSEGKIPLMEAGAQFFGKVGMTLKLSPEMMKIRRNFWDISNESPQAWGEKIAREVGGIFKISGNVASIVGRSEGVNTDGEKMPNIDAVWGINLIGWRIKPFVSRPEYGSAASRFFDLDEGMWKQTEESIKAAFPFGQSIATAVSMASEVDKNVAGQKVQGNSEMSKWEKGVGWCLINGEPRAKCSATLTISGARPGINGTYRMEEVEHNYQRGVGYTTRIVVRAPNPATEGKNNGFGNDPGAPPPPSLSNPAEPAPEPKRPEESTAEYLRRLAFGTEEGRIEGRFRAGFISRAEADRLIAQIRRRNLTAVEQERIRRYSEERRQGFAQ
jgi:hypothetical protein